MTFAAVALAAAKKASSFAAAETPSLAPPDLFTS